MAGQTKVIVSNNIANIKKQINVLEAERSRLIDNPPRGVKPGKNPDKNYGEDYSMGRSFFYTEGAKQNKSVIESYIKKVEALDRRIQDLKKRLNTNPDMLRHSAELYHHGILGMHWGVRRYQPYGHGGYDPKGDLKKLNKVANDKNFVNLRNRASVAAISTKLTKAQYDYSKRNKDSEGMMTYKNQHSELIGELKDLKSKMSPYQNDVNQCVKNIEKNGYTINSKQVTDWKELGKRSLVVGGVTVATTVGITAATGNPMLGRTVGGVTAINTSRAYNADKGPAVKTKYYAKKKEN